MVVLGCLFLIGLGLWMLLSPQSLFWKTAAWQFRHPEANEPSEIAYGLGRVVGAGMVLLGIVVIVISISEPTDAEREAEEQQEEQEEREQEAQARDDLLASAEELDA